MIGPALFSFTVFAGSCLVLAVAALLGLGAVCWGMDIGRDIANRWRYRAR